MKPLLPVCLLLAPVLSQCVCPSDFRRVEVPRVATAADVASLSDCQIQHYGTTLLATNGSVAITRALLERGAKPHGKLISNGKAQNGTALAHVNDERVLRELLAAGLDANALVNGEHETPLCNVTTRGSNHLLPDLLAAGADPNRTGARGLTPLYIAASHVNEDACRILLRHGAQPNFGSMEDSSAPLHGCLKADSTTQQRQAVMQVLLAAGADANAADAQGRTPLFYCSTPAEAEALLAAGAEINAKDHQGNTAFDAVPHAAVKSYLLVRGAAGGKTL